MPTILNNNPTQSCYALLPSETQIDFTGNAQNPASFSYILLKRLSGTANPFTFAANVNNAAGALTATEYVSPSEQGSIWDYEIQDQNNPADISNPIAVNVAVCCSATINAPTQSCDVMPPNQTDVDFTGTTNDNTATFELWRQEGMNPPIVAAIATNNAGALTARNGVTPPDSGKTYNYAFVLQNNPNIYSPPQVVNVMVCPVVPPTQNNGNNIPVPESIETEGNYTQGTNATTAPIFPYLTSL